MDLSLFTGFESDVTTAIATVGAAVVGAFVLVQAYPFVTGWIAKIRKAGQGKAGA